MSEKNKVLSDEEVKRRRKRTSEKEKQKELQNFGEKEILSQTEIGEDGRATITLESEGRFDMPSLLSFNDYSMEDINNITLTKHEKMVDVLINTLDKLKVTEVDCSMINLLLEEFLEIMVGMKAKYVGVSHTHRWLCDCQYDVPEKDQIINEAIINLSQLNFTSISQADERLREYMRPWLEEMSSSEFQEYIQKAYGDKSSEELSEMNVDSVLQDIHIKEPIKINKDDHTYEFRFIRIGDLILARKMAEDKFAGLFKKIQVQKFNDKGKMDILEFKRKKEEAITELKEEQARYAILSANAMRLIRIDGQDVITKEEKVGRYKKLNPQIIQQLDNWLDELRFGVDHKQDFVCPLCGETKQRSLHSEFNPLEFLPLDVDTSRKQGLTSRFNISFGTRA